MEMVNPFDSYGRWFKANLHTHSTVSDGELSVKQRVQQYRKEGYDILALTDHEATSDVAGMSDENYLVISGIETHPICPQMKDIYHLIGLDVPFGFEFSENADAQSRIDKVKKIGGEVIFAHPYWCGMNINHLMSLNGYIAIEVYNATCSKRGKAFSSVCWDDLGEAGRIVGGVAVDDVHEGRDLFMGWTMIKAEELTVKAVMQALRTGCYYSTTGPVIEDFRIEDGKALVKCSPAAEVHFMVKRCYGRARYAEDGPPITSTHFTLPKEQDRRSALGYVRAEIVDYKGNRAWSNPIVL